MSRNSNRTSINHNIPQPPNPMAPPPQRNVNPFNIDLVAATEVVKLPSGGKFYQEGSSLHGVSQVEIRHLTAREEDILANQQFLLDGSMFTRLLKSIIVDRSIDPNDLISGDRNALLLAARVTGYGNSYVIKEMCPNCGANAEFEYDLDKTTPVHELPKGVELEEATGLFKFELPKTKMEVMVRILTAADEDYLRKQNEKAESLGIANNKTINFFRMSVVSVNGVSEQAQLNQLFDVLPAIDSRKIRHVCNNLSPDVSTKQMVACGSCGEETESEVPFNLGFFWPDV